MLGDPAVVEQAEPVLQSCQRMPERLSLELHPTMQTACEIKGIAELLHA